MEIVAHGNEELLEPQALGPCSDLLTDELTPLNSNPTVAMKGWTYAFKERAGEEAFSQREVLAVAIVPLLSLSLKVKAGVMSKTLSS